MGVVYYDEFEPLVAKAKSLEKPMRVAVAAANSENILRGVFAAEDDGFIKPVLIGNNEKIHAVIEAIGKQDRSIEIQSVYGGDNPVQYAIEMINAGDADTLMRGNCQTRDYLLPVLNKANHLIEDDTLVTHIVFLKIPGYKKIVGISDVTLLIDPDIDQRKQVLLNMVEALKILDVQHPNIALLSLVEKPSFHMRDTVEDQTLVSKHLKYPIADCNIAGPISYDLIMSKEAARLKGYDCPYCGEFDGIVVPNLMAGNLLVKTLMHNAGAFGFGLLTGAKIPIAISGRSDAPEQTYLSLAACAAKLAEKK